MKNKSFKMMIQDYDENYGHIPSEQNEILSFLEKELKLTEKDFAKIKAEEEYVASIPWNTLTITLPIVPKPSPRPRHSRISNCFYVTGAAENKKLFKHYIEREYDIISTQTYLSMRTYLPTPKSMTRTDIYRAEKGSIMPVSNPDWDNLGKTYSDMIQKILLLNDNIITKGFVEKFYSVKPRVEMYIKYQQGYDSKFNKRRILNSKSYKDWIEIGNPIEVYIEGDEFW